MSFDPEDIELEDEIESLERNYEEDFKMNKNELCIILDQALFDVNCVNFFDKQ